MAQTGTTHRPGRTLGYLAAIIFGLAALLVSANIWSTGTYAPKLGLDLEGGTQIILAPRLTGTTTVSQEQLDQARDIIVQRVDANGVSGAEVTTQGGQNIVVSIPDEPTQEVEDAIRKSSQMQFRPVLAAQPGSAVPAPENPLAPSTTAPTSPTDPATSPVPAPTTSAPTGDATLAPPVTPSPTSSTNNAVLPPALRAETTPPAPTTPAPADATTPPAEKVRPTSPTDPNWLTWDEKLAQEFLALDCSQRDPLADIVDDPELPLVTCDADGREKYILGPVVVPGSEIADASAGYQALPNGQPSSTVEIQLTFKDTGKDTYAAVSEEMVKLPDPRNRLAATLDSEVIVAPAFQSAIPNGQASITGSFTIESARALAQQLKFGALPMSFDLQTREQISPTIGGEQLRFGLIAGVIGMILVFGFSLFQYHALGFVTIGSLIIAGTMTYLAMTILGWSHNLRLDMAGVTGAIVAIGVTADSFIVYFERIRDEVREGRTLRSAVDVGWLRGRRTVFAGDFVNVIAAIVLYLLAAANVRGFAFMLGLTTILDLLVVVMFTHPMVTLLVSKTKYFGEGRKWSGLDQQRLGAKTTRYVGRGRFRPPSPKPSAQVARGVQTS